MDRAASVPVTQSEANPNATITLDQAREKLRALLLDSETNGWEIGDLLNWIEKRGLVRSEGYGKHELGWKRQCPRLKTR
jgi:hypothetical protein